MLIFLLACQDDSLTQVLDDLDAAAAATDTFVADHVADVTAAATLDDVAAAEADYTAGWPDHRTALSEALDMCAKCAMDDSDTMTMDATMAAFEAMDAAIPTHGSDQAACADLAACLAVETTHQAEMLGYTDTIRAARADWEDGTMECSMGGMAGM